MPTLYFKIIQQICIEKGYQFKNLDSFSEILAQITTPTRQVLISSKGYPLNTASAMKIANDKALTGLVLKNAGINVPEGDYFFISPERRQERPNGKELLDAINYAKVLNYPVFIKPINGLSGNFALLIDNEADLSLSLQRMAQKYFAVIIQKPLFQVEQRIFVLDNKVRFAYTKKRTMIVGDGVSSIKTLMLPFIENQQYFVNSEYIQNNLVAKGYSYTTVLNAEEQFFLSSNANPNSGGIISEIYTSVSKECEAWAINIAKTMGLDLCGIDFFVPQNLTDNPSKFTVIEVNANPSLRTLWRLGYQELIKSIWEDILQKSFK